MRQEKLFVSYGLPWVTHDGRNQPYTLMYYYCRVNPCVCHLILLLLCVPYLYPCTYVPSSLYIYALIYWNTQHREQYKLIKQAVKSLLLVFLSV